MSTIKKDIFQIYNAKCITCDSSIELPDANYQLMYSPDINRCIPCLRNDKLCSYFHRQVLYVTCLDISLGVGDGTIVNPFNLRLWDYIDWDGAILSGGVDAAL